MIRKVPVREHDQLVVLYCRALGKLTAIAKGSLRPHSTQALALDEANIIEAELVEGKANAIITGAQSHAAWSSLKRRPASWAVAQVFLQIVDMLVYEGQADTALWDTLIDVLRRIDGAVPDQLASVYRQGQIAMLQVLGYGSPHEGVLSDRWARTSLDEQFEVLAQRRIPAIDVLYDVVATSAP